MGAVSIVASVVGALFVKAKEGGSVMGALYKGVIISGVLAAIAFYPITGMMEMSIHYVRLKFLINHIHFLLVNRILLIQLGA